MPVRIKWPYAKHRVQQLEMANQVILFTAAAAPVNGTTGAGTAGPGSLYIDSSGKKLYVNTGTLASPTWTVAGAQT